MKMCVRTCVLSLTSSLFTLRLERSRSCVLANTGTMFDFPSYNNTSIEHASCFCDSLITLPGMAGRHPHTVNWFESIPNSSFVSLKAVSISEASPSSAIPPGKLCHES